MDDDLGIDSLAPARLIEVVPAKAGIVILGEETVRVRAVSDSQDIRDAHAPGTAE